MSSTNVATLVAMAGSDASAAEWARRGPQKYAATVPAVYDLWQDPQERYNLFMNSFTEKTWMMVLFNKDTSDLMKTYEANPPRKLQSETYTGPMQIERFRKIDKIKSLLKKKGIDLNELKD
ncbi:arylsulfatase [Rhodopirellula baltica]|uniref:arylsulfatase n=1 Tax=Rhodopirellula baltica TaxID=265606 RepID=UPI001F3490AF|nr:arylsulfatase [Rhodopirellula baltica]